MITGLKKLFFICILPLINWWCLSHEFYRHDNKSTSRRERVMCCYSIFEQSPAPKTKVQWRRRMQHALLKKNKPQKPFQARKMIRIPLRISIGLAPLLILSNPSLAMARARTVAQVVPSPASSLVLLATSWTSLAPMFWYLSCRSMALATVTPSLVILGLPQLCSMMTFLPCKLEIYRICAFFVHIYLLPARIK